MFLPVGSRASSPTSPTLPQCRDVELRAAYLAEEKPGQGPGFYLQIENRRAVQINIADPAPLSIHWYARSGGRWLWRASSGDGGSLVNAFRESGPVFAAKGSLRGLELQTRTIAAHATYSWSVFTAQMPALRYRPGCQHCTYQGEEQYQAVLAYAYLPSGSDASTPFLHCGLRSKPVVMPPLADSPAIHNSAGR